MTIPTHAEAVEATALLGRTLDRLLALTADAHTTASADVARLCGALRAGATAWLRGASDPGALLACFAASRAAGATFREFAGLAAATGAEAPVTPLGLRLQAAAWRYAVIQMARITAATTYTSSTDALAALAGLVAAFDPVEEAAADTFDSAAYRALVALRAAAVADLTARARPLPRLVNRTFPRGRPVLALAQRLYGDASRADEIRRENKAANPVFMPAAVRVLSS